MCLSDTDEAKGVKEKKISFVARNSCTDTYLIGIKDFLKKRDYHMLFINTLLHVYY